MSPNLNEFSQEPAQKDSAPSFLNPQNPWNAVWLTLSFRGEQSEALRGFGDLPTSTQVVTVGGQTQVILCFPPLSPLYS